MNFAIVFENLNLFLLFLKLAYIFRARRARGVGLAEAVQFLCHRGRRERVRQRHYSARRSQTRSVPHQRCYAGI